MANLNRYPYVPFAGHTDTSAAAAEAVAKNHRSMQDSAMAAIREAGPEGLTADEAANVMGVSPYQVRPRTAELRAQGYIKDSEKRRPNIYNRPSIVWVATSSEERRQILADKAANDAERNGTHGNAQNGEA